VRLDRAADSILVTDQYALRAPGKIEMSLMTPCTVRADGARAVILSGGMLGAASVRIAVEAAAAPFIRTEEIAIADSRLRASWGNRLVRTLVGWESAPATGELKFEITRV
jgi:hypothetical protein